MADKGRWLETPAGPRFEIACTSGVACVPGGIEYEGLNASVFTFDHRDPNTKNPKLYRKGSKLYELSFDEMVAELAKCDLFCSNCHTYLRSAKY